MLALRVPAGSRQATLMRKWCRWKSLVATLNEFDASCEIERASTAPASWYTEPKWLQEEARIVFGTNWLHVANLHQVKAPGDYISGTILKRPYIVVRGEDGVLRAFYNVCSHHAARVVDGSGCGSTFTCPYHAWEFDTLGRLRKAVKMKGIKDFRPKDYGLKPIRCDTLGHLVMLDFGGQAESLSSQYGPAQEVLEKYGRYDKLTFQLRKIYHINCNWKVFADNFCDGGYHVPIAHKEYSSTLDMSNYHIAIHDKCSIQRSSGDTIKDIRVGSTQYFMFLYPTLIINRYGNWMDTNTIVPLGDRECNVIFDYYLDVEGALEHSKVADSEKDAWLSRFISDSLHVSDKVQREDEYLCESVQEGLESGAYISGRYAPNIEQPMYHFHQLLYRNMAKYL